MAIHKTVTVLNEKNYSKEKKILSKIYDKIVY